jgi:hypothetical protein
VRERESVCVCLCVREHIHTHRPWETAQMPTVALANEDWGCEGRYNSGYGCLSMCCCFSVLAWMRVSWGSAAATAVIMWFVVLAAAFPAAHILKRALNSDFYIVNILGY